MKSDRTTIPGLALTDHHLEVPLDYGSPKGSTISVYAREVVSADAEGKGLPYLLFLQGGPGGASPRPMGPDGWIGEMCSQFRVVLLDQRGTGRSTPTTSIGCKARAPRTSRRATCSTSAWILS